MPSPWLRPLLLVKRRIWRRRLRRMRRCNTRPLYGPRVLVVMDAGIGNAVEATPLVQAIRVHWPRAHLTLIVPPGDLFEGWCVPDRLCSERREIEGASFDLVLATWATPPFPGALRPERVFPDWLLRPERECNLDLIREHGYRGAAPPLYVSESRPEAAPPDAEQRIVLADGGKEIHRWRNKRWPRFGALARALLDRFDAAQICLIGRAGEGFREGTPASERLIDLRGRLGLRELAWLLRRAALVIGNDCGPMHVADAVLAPCLVLHGPTCEIKNGPRNRGVTLSAGIACSPCQYDLALLDGCEEARCMQSIKVDAVLERAAGMLREGGR